MFKKPFPKVLLLALVLAVSLAAFFALPAEALKGTVEAIHEDAIVVDGQTIKLTDDTVLHGDLVVGATVEVEVHEGEDGSLIAGEVYVVEPGGELNADVALLKTRNDFSRRGRQKFSDTFCRK